MKATTTNKPSELAQSFATLLSTNFSAFPSIDKATTKQDIEQYLTVINDEVKKLHNDIVIPMREFRLKLKKQRGEIKKLARQIEKPAKEKKVREPKASKKKNKTEVVGYIETKSPTSSRIWKTPVTKEQLAKQPELAEKLISVDTVNAELAKRGEEMKAVAANKTKAVPKPSAKIANTKSSPISGIAENKVAYKSKVATSKKVTTKKVSK